MSADLILKSSQSKLLMLLIIPVVMNALYYNNIFIMYALNIVSSQFSQDDLSENFYQKIINSYWLCRCFRIILRHIVTCLILTFIGQWES